MAQLVRESLTDYRIRDRATKLLHLFYASNYIEWINSVLHHSRVCFTLIGEPDEMLISPSRMMDMLEERGTIFGDCDDVAMFIASMGLSIGLAARFRAVFPDSGGTFQHVYAELMLPNGIWVEVDPTAPPDKHQPWMGDSITVEV